MGHLINRASFAAGNLANCSYSLKFKFDVVCIAKSVLDLHQGPDNKILINHDQFPITNNK